MPEDNKPKPVINGKVRVANKSLWRKIGETFAAGNLKDAKNYVISDVIVPSILDMIYDGITRGASKLIYGDNAPKRDKNRRFGSGINYNSYSRSDNDSIITIKRKKESPVSDIYDYNELELESNADAKDLLDSMYEFLEEHDVISVGDMYAMARYEGGDYTDHNWGWDDLRGSAIVRGDHGWILKLPRVKNLKDIK